MLPGCEQLVLSGIPNDLFLRRIELEISVLVVGPVNAGYKVASLLLGDAVGLGSTGV